jgi:predicted transcriptional regulator
MSNREIVIDVLSKLPEDISFEEMARKIEFLAGVQEGLEQADRGEEISGEELLRMVDRWPSE